MTDLEKIKKDALGFPDVAKRIIVHNSETLMVANNFLTTIKSIKEEINGAFNPIIKKAHQAHKEAVAQKKKYDEPLTNAERIIKNNISAYMENQARIRREKEEEDRKKEEARQKEEDRILAEAKILEDSGKDKEAQSLMAEIPLPARIEIPPEPEVEGLSIRQVVDTERINKLVTDSRGQVEIPGIEIYPIWMWKVVDRKLIPKSYYKSSVASRKGEG